MQRDVVLGGSGVRRLTERKVAHLHVVYTGGEVTTAERAREMKQPPVYILNHAQATDAPRSTMGTLAEHQDSCRRLARKLWEGSGLGPADVDVFTPYDGYLQFAEQFKIAQPLRDRRGNGSRPLKNFALCESGKESAAAAPFSSPITAAA